MIFLDVETQNDWTGGENFSLKDLKISYVGVIDDQGLEMDFWENDIPKLGELMKSSDMIVGYNIFGFDTPVIANYLGEDVVTYPQLDLMVAVHKEIGFRPKLDSLTSATFGEGKIGSGADAVRYWASGDLESLKKYCIMDVKLTKKLYEFGLEKGYVKYMDKKGFIRETKIDWENGKRISDRQPDIITMF